LPLIIRIHGGAFKSGDKSGEASSVPALQARGYAVASLNYRMSGEAKFPAGAQDVKAAVRWLRANAATYGIDPNRFAAWGGSAGSCFAGLLGVTGDQATLLDDFSLGHSNVSSAVQAVIDWFGPVDFGSMDNQQRAAPPAACPTTWQQHDIVLHGGAFRGGDKGHENVAQFLNAGFAAASLNYRLSGDAIFPPAVQDCKAAVRWLRANAAKYNLDSDQFGAWGASAGGNLVAMLGTTGDT
jgi:acetyl esterase/lipase